MSQEMLFTFNPKKNNKLKVERGVTFDQVIWCIENGYLLDVLPHHDQKKYPGQKIMVIEMNEYAYLVPFEVLGDEVGLKTIFPSRKATKRYLKK